MTWSSVLPFTLELCTEQSEQWLRKSVLEKEGGIVKRAKGFIIQKQVSNILWVKIFTAVLFIVAKLVMPRDFPGGPVVKNLPANAGDRGSIPGQGRSHVLWSNWDHAPWLLNPHAVTSESTCCNHWSPCAYSACSTTREATTVRSPSTETKSSSCSPQLDKACVQRIHNSLQFLVIFFCAKHLAWLIWPSKEPCKIKWVIIPLLRVRKETQKRLRSLIHSFSWHVLSTH